MMSVAESIQVAQLGGDSAFVMLGTKQRSAMPAGIQFKIGRNAKGVTHVMIVLDDDDTYTVTFYRIRGYVTKVTGVFSGVYADQLRSTVESGTGMYLSL